MPLSAVDEFRDLVKALHRAGLEIILDVVFNHTAEGGPDDPTFCFRGLANDEYYLLGADRARYADYTGTGNTLNASHSIVRRLILDSLRYWVTEMHVDGFRFDLAAVLSRDTEGRPMTDPPTPADIDTDPVLAGTKLIAEAWDAGGLYEVGSFPGDRWIEWNGRFRDDVRSFVKSDPGKAGAVAERFLASPDIYGPDAREPGQSVNFVTCHDGFTLNDLVTYDAKHNDANGEGGRDGSDQNLSWNCGVEGPTDDPAVEQLRRRQVKNLLAINLLAAGVPMLLMGDEVRRTQLGNNNAYCQDGPLSWFDWSGPERHADILRFTRMLTAGRRRIQVLLGLAHDGSLVELLAAARVELSGVRLGQPDTSAGSRSIALTVSGRHASVHVILNAYWEPLDFEVPPQAGDLEPWRRYLDTSLEVAGRHRGRGRRPAGRHGLPCRAALGGRAGQPAANAALDDGGATLMDAERERMRDAGRPEEGLESASPWYRWGPYLSERAWGTVREDYSADGDAWAYFPHDHARSRAYRRGEDGLAGISDVFSRLCLGLALWNGRDPILKERIFGLANGEGNHGEDAKEYWWYLDAVPSGAWLRWRYHYPQAAFPYDDLVAENGRRSKLEPEYELLDTGVFDDGYWVVEVHYAKAEPDDILVRVVIRNRGPETATLHVLPTLWFRNTWSWDPGSGRPSLAAAADGTAILATHPDLGSYALVAGAAPDGSRPELLFCDNDTNTARVFGAADEPGVPEGRHQRPRRGRRADGRTRLAPGRRPPPGIASACRPGRPPRCACGSARASRRARPRLRWGRPSRTRSATPSPRSCANARRRPTPSTPACGGPTRPTRRRGSCARPSPGCCGASRPTSTTCRAGSTATRRNRRRRPPG